MKNKHIYFKKDDLLLFLSNKKNYLSVEINEKEEFDFQKNFYEKYYRLKASFLLRYVGDENNKLIFEFPDDFNFNDYHFKTKYYFLTNLSKLKNLLNYKLDKLEYDKNNFVLKSILELKPKKTISFSFISKIYNFIFKKSSRLYECDEKSAAWMKKNNNKFFNNTVSDLYFNKILIHKKEKKFYFLDYRHLSLSDKLAIEDGENIINYSEI